MKKPSLKHSILLSCLFAIQLLGLASRAESAQKNTWLWQIGVPGRTNGEFALAPNGYNRFAQDAFFIVGHSDSKRDWPYAHPGPADSWAGQREHTFTILFGIKNPPASGDCRLRIDLLDTQKQTPPQLQIQINGREFKQSLPAGSGDESIYGQPEKGSPFGFDIPFPAELLKAGENTIAITTRSGSWMLYDWIGLETPAGIELQEVTGRTFVERIQAIRALIRREGKFYQPIRIGVRHLGDPVHGSIRVSGSEAVPIQLEEGVQTLETYVAAVERESTLEVAIESSGKTLTVQSVTVKPVHPMTVYILPHSHTDIGYTEIQTAIEEKQVQNLLTGIEYARQTADYPEGARFIWNVEVLWAADLYLQRLSNERRAEFFDAVKKGWVGLNGMYLNELTGLCRPEELLQLFRYSTQLAEQCGVTIDSAMISDVPGYTWGTVTAMAKAGIKYFSTAPNYFDRIGDILQQWENKPFYWLSPSSNEKVLVWIPLRGYALSHMIGKLSPEFVEDYMTKLSEMNYPYEIAHLRWSGHGDNAVPDKTICEFVKDWNGKYDYPRFLISTTSDAFRAFEERYGSQLPEVKGDWTPYWEDGAGSSAQETAMNRASSDRIVQAQTLWTMLDHAGYPLSGFDKAWRNILLYSEHTWGAWCSVSDPENSMTREQWEIKQSYALEADRQTRELLDSVLANHSKSGLDENAIDVFNTTSWPRTELVIVPRELSRTGDRVTNERGKAIPSQRLSTGELAFLASDVPPLAAKRFGISPEKPLLKGKARVEGTTLDNGLIRVRVDEKTGGIIELRARGLDANFADTASGNALNDYLFLPGDDLADLQRNGPVKISVKESGPLVVSLLIESEAPGCRALKREVRLTSGLDYVETINIVDKERAPANPKPGDWTFAQKGGKESVNFAFPFHVPEGVMRLDLPIGVIQPESGQIPSACKNWFTVGRWADVSNEKMGVTWATLDAPLVQVGELSARLLGSQNNPDVWRKKVEPTQTLYSWAMNNHWGTNYRAYQEGPVVFRYALRPHRRFEADSAFRFATGLSQPLIVARAGGSLPKIPRFQIEPDGVETIAYKPSDDGKAWIIRLYNAADRDQKIRLRWPKPAPTAVWIGDTSEKPLQKADKTITVSAWDIVTLRVEFSEAKAR